VLGSTDEMVGVKNDDEVFSSEGDVSVQFQILPIISQYQVSGCYCRLHFDRLDSTIRAWFQE